MSAGEWEVGHGMIKGSGFPGVGGVALGAILIKIIFDMTGIVNGVEIRFMTGKTLGGSGLVTLIVTGDTTKRNVSPGEREVSESVIEGGRFPSIGGVALGAILIKIVFNMTGIVNGIEVLFMTGKTLGGSGLVTLIVTGDTTKRNMSAGEREVSEFVIESCRLPGIGGVALGAILIKIIFDMTGIVNGIEVLFMTGKTLGGSGLVALIMT